MPRHRKIHRLEKKSWKFQEKFPKCLETFWKAGGDSHVVDSWYHFHSFSVVGLGKEVERSGKTKETPLEFEAA